MTPEIVYVVRGKVAKNALNTIKKGDTVWLTWSPDSGGWHNWSHAAAPIHAKRFSTPDEARRVARACHGPWYSMPDPNTIEVLEADWYPPVAGRLEIKQWHSRP